VQVFLTSHSSGPSAVTIRLAEGVRWGLRFDGGASDLVANLRSGRVAGVDFAAGDSHIGLDLPQPRGTVPVQLSGGASELSMHAPNGVPVRVAVQSGAASVELDGVAHDGIAAGTVFAPPGWSTAGDRYDVVAHAGVSTLTLTRYP
jgi:hypothetical protein